MLHRLYRYSVRIGSVSHTGGWTSRHAAYAGCAALYRQAIVDGWAPTNVTAYVETTDGDADGLYTDSRGTVRWYGPGPGGEA